MAFCGKCGRELKEGEKCNCQGQAVNQNFGGNFNRTVGEKSQNVSAQGNKSKLIIIIGAVAMIIGCFMPFGEASMFGMSASVSYTEGDGIGVIVLAIIAALLAVINLQKLSVIPTAIALFITLYDVSQISADSQGMASPAIGAYVIIIGAVIAGVGGILAYVWKRNVKNNNLA